MRKLFICKLLICVNLVIALFIVMPVFGVGTVVGRNCVVSWNANLETDLAGYHLFIGTVPGSYVPPQTILAPATSITCANAGITVLAQYYVTLTAYDISGNESGNAVELPFQLADLEPPVVPVGLEVKDAP